MNNKDIQYFLTLVNEKNISKAAEKLYISQPSLSKYLIRLEENLGHQLFERGARTLDLTKPGESYLNYIKQLEILENKLAHDLSTFDDPTKGEINIGTTVWRSSVFMPLIVPSFQKKYPNINIRLYEGSHDELNILLKEDILNFALVHSPNSIQNTNEEILFDEKILLCVNKYNPISKVLNHKETSSAIKTLSKKDLAVLKGEEIITLREGQHLREQTDNLYKQLNIEPNIILKTSNIVTAIRLVNNNMGITFTPESMLLDSNLSHLKDLVFFYVDESLTKWDFVYIYHENNYLTPQSVLFINYFKEFTDKLKL